MTKELADLLPRFLFKKMANFVPSVVQEGAPTPFDALEGGPPDAWYEPNIYGTALR